MEEGELEEVVGAEEEEEEAMTHFSLDTPGSTPSTCTASGSTRAWQNRKKHIHTYTTFLDFQYLLNNLYLYNSYLNNN